MTQFQGPMQPWPALAPFGRTVRLPGDLNVFVYTAGQPEAPALVLIHGLGDEADTWRHLFQPLAERYYVTALDLPGFGRSDKPRRAYTLPFLRDTVLALLDALGLARAALLGHSLGAVIAQSVALAQPERIPALTLLDGSLTSRAAKLNQGLLLMALPVVGAQIYNGLRRDPRAAYESLRPFYARLDDLPQADREFLFQRVNERVWSDGQRDAFLSILRHLVWTAPREQAKQEARLARLATPTHALWGELDAINSVESGRALTAVQATARLTVLAGLGHAPHQEAPEAVLRAFHA
ncbi:MAG: alpha/beta fold hydrolase [Anaerolineales bacterium]|nr:alpha/beta fold hydrolase [Anaerolineales bacterium]